ncbi:MAG: CYTH domain-containing protein [Proteobacteria bacterium]|nr:MAG: CYTH domain-containing protein [Pseudomonadota bacterium]
MNSEIEAKFVNVDHDDVRKKLKSVGAICEHQMRLMRRSVFHNDTMVGKDAYVRVRDEGDKVTMTYKQFDDATSINGVREIETIVGDFETAVAILEQTGLSKDTYQETKRETWMLDDVEVVLDRWPWVDPYIEIEGPSEERVRSVAEALKFEWDDAVFGGAASVYVLKYPMMGDQAAEIINRKTPVIRFEDPVPRIFTGEL